MTHVRLATALILLPLLALPALAASPAENAVREYLTLAHEGHFAALPKAEGAGTERFEQKLRGVLRVRCARVDGIAIQGTNDGFDVDFAVSRRGRGGGDWMPAEVTPLRVRVTEQDGGWLVSGIEFADEALADRLIAANAEERQKLLREHADRITGGVARAIYRRALETINSSRTVEAPAIAALARDIAQRTGDRGAESLALGIDVIFARIQRELHKGIRIGRESVAIAEETGDPDVIARSWQNLSRLIVLENWARKDKSDEAVAAENHALQRALVHAERAEDATILVRVLENLALRASDAGDYFTARQYQERLLPIAREVGDRMGEIGYYIQVANLYFGQGDRELGFFHHKRAMELTKRYDPRRHPYTLIRYGGLLVVDKRYDEARAAFDEALVRDERGALQLATNSVSGNMAAFALRNLGIIAAEEGKLDEAECWLEEGQKLLLKTDPLYHGAVFAPYFAAKGDHATALRLSLQTLTGSNNVIAMLEAARAYRALGEWNRAMALTREAIDWSEEREQRLAAGGDEQQIRSADRIAACYELAAELALERGNDLEALAFLESGRGRVLAEVIEKGRPGAGAAAELAEEKVRIEHERGLVRINVDLNRAVAGGDRNTIAALEEQLRERRHLYESFADGMLARSVRRGATRRRIWSSDIAQLMERLPTGLAAVEYFVARDRLHIFVVRRGASGNATVTQRTIDTGRDDIEKKVTRFVKAISDNDLRVRDAAHDLYAVLIAPVENELRAAETLLVIPDDILWRVSFAALADARGRFLVERWPLVYAPSITVFAEMDERRRRRREPGVLLAVGNPTMDTASASNFRSYYRSSTLGALPHAETEIDAVRSLYEQSLVFKRDDATESRIKSAIPNAHIVHFATHGLLDDRNPMYSRLALARGGEATEDGWLETWEIARLDTDAELVVLSACETARGQIGDGEGVVGMAWSFFVAGARSTLATQWKVESEHTAQLMIRFHESLRGGATNKARALREAQLRSIRDARYRHPFYWAAFVLIGSAE